MSRCTQRLPVAVLAGAVAMAIAACNSNLGGFSGNVGNTPNTYASLSFFFTSSPCAPGAACEPFSATVTDADASWKLKEHTPFRVVLINNVQPGGVQVTKTANDTNSLSVQIVRGHHQAAEGSTSTPNVPFYLATKKKFTKIAPAANPDVRIYVSGPATEHFSGLIEDCSTGFQVDSVAPVEFMFEDPNGPVDGQFFQIQNLGPFTVDMTVDGVVVDSVTGGPSVTVCQGGCPTTC